MDYTIRQLTEKILSGQIQIPAFQRGFVWEAQDVAHLMDSIYKGFPFGSLLFWRTKECLKKEKNIEYFELIEKEEGFPIDYVLDGQQRLTSIFGVFQNTLKATKDSQKFNIYFDLLANVELQDTQFVSLESSQVNIERHFPIKTFFDSVEYRKATDNLSNELKVVIDKIQDKFKEVKIPIQLLETNNKEMVAIVFERINRKGVELDTIQLLSAWTWSEDFDLNDQFNTLCSDLSDYGFNDIGEDADLILKCSAAILAGNSSSKSLIELQGAVVRTNFNKIENGIKGALDFLNRNMNIYHLKNLPTTHILIPLSAFFAIEGNQHFYLTNEQKNAIIKWFWKVCFSKRYSSSTNANLNKDIEEILKLKNNQPNNLNSFRSDITEQYFIENEFRASTIASKTLVLILALETPKSFISGGNVSLSPVLKDYNKNEFHHLYPNAYLKSQGISPEKINCLANFCFISRADNQKLGGKAPSEYRREMPSDLQDILSRSICPDSLFNDNYDLFLDERAKMLLNKANMLMK